MACGCNKDKSALQAKKDEASARRQQALMEVRKKQKKIFI